MISHRILLPINILTVPNLNHQDHQLLVLNLADDTEVTHAVSPQLAERRALERFAQAARVFPYCEPVSEKI